jgi:hypothetical protein
MSRKLDEPLSRRAYGLFYLALVKFRSGTQRFIENDIENFALIFTA